MAEIPKHVQQRTGWMIVAVGIITPVVLVALGVDLEAVVDSLLGR